MMMILTDAAADDVRSHLQSIACISWLSRVFAAQLRECATISCTCGWHLLPSCVCPSADMCCFAWLLASRPFRRCAPAATSRSSTRSCRRRSDDSQRSRSSMDDVIRSSTLSAAGPLLSTASLPVQPLTEREVIVLVQSWKAIQKHFVESGVSMFLR